MLHNIDLICCKYVQLTTSLCNSLFNSDVIFMRPMNTKNIPSKIDKLFRTIDDPMMCAYQRVEFTIIKREEGRSECFSCFPLQVLQRRRSQITEQLLSPPVHPFYASLLPRTLSLAFPTLGRKKRKNKEKCSDNRENSHLGFVISAEGRKTQRVA